MGILDTDDILLVNSLSQGGPVFFFAGTISQAHLDGVGLTCTLYNVCIMSVSQGYGYVFETYGPQVYGPSQSGELTTVLIKCLLQGVMVHLVIMGPYLNLVYIFDMLPQSGSYPASENGETVPEDQPVDFRDVAAHFLRITMLFQLLEYGVFISCTYFAIQGKTKLVYVVCGIMVATHALANYIFVSVLEMEVAGLGIAGFTGRFLGFSASLAICFFGIKTGRFPWKRFSRKVFLGWKNMIILGFCGAVRRLFTVRDNVIFESVCEHGDPLGSYHSAADSSGDVECYVCDSPDCIQFDRTSPGRGECFKREAVHKVNSVQRHPCSDSNSSRHVHS